MVFVVSLCVGLAEFLVPLCSDHGQDVDNTSPIRGYGYQTCVDMRLVWI